MARAYPMASADAAWLHMDRPTNLMVINAVLWFDEPLDWERTRRRWLERVVAPFPRFRQVAREGGPGAPPAWHDEPDFDPEPHFQRLALPAPGDRAALQAVVSEHASRPLDRSRPLWEVYLLDGYGRGCALLARMHHAIADGIALARVLMSMTDDGGSPADFAAASERDGGGPLAAIARPAGTAVGLGRALLHEGLETVLHPLRVGRLACMAGADALTLARLLAPVPDSPSALRGELGTAQRVAWSDPISLTSVRRAAHLADATVNDVLVAAVAGALGRYLRAGEGAPPELHALVPFNLRPIDQPLPRHLGNRFGLIVLGLPVGTDDPIARLRAVHQRMQEIKRSHEAVIAYGVLETLGRAPAALEARFVDAFSAKGSLVLTNVPGPARTVGLGGTPVRGVLVWAPCSGRVGMSVSVFSYAGKVTAGFLVDAGLVEDPQPLADGFRREALRLVRRVRAAEGGGARRGGRARP